MSLSWTTQWILINWNFIFYHYICISMDVIWVSEGIAHRSGLWKILYIHWSYTIVYMTSVWLLRLHLHVHFSSVFIVICHVCMLSLLWIYFAKCYVPLIKSNHVFVTLAFWAIHAILVVIFDWQYQRYCCHFMQLVWISDAHFMHNFSFVIQIQWKFHSALIQVVVKWSLWNFASGRTAVLWWQVQNFVVVWYPTPVLH